MAGITVGALGWILGANRAVRIVLNPLAGRLYDRGRRRRLFVVAMALGTISTGLYVAAEGFWPLLVGRLVWGTAWALLLVGGYAIVLDVTNPANRGRYMGLFQAWYFVGGAFGVALGGLLKDAIGYRETLWVCLGLTSLGMVAAALLLPETGKRSRVQPAPRIKLPRLGRTWLAGIDRRILAANYVNLVHYFVGNGVLFSTIGLALQQWAGDRTALFGPLGVASLTGFLLAGRAVLSVVVAPAAGALSDVTHGRWRVIGAGMVVMLAGFVVLAVGSGVWPLIVGVVIISVGGGILAPALTAFVGDLTPVDREGVAMGTFATAGDVGSAAGPILAYALVTSFALAWVYALCSVLILTAVAVLYFSRNLV